MNSADREMGNDEYLSHLHTIWLLARATASLPFDELNRAQQRAEALGPLLDPTSHLRNADRFHQDCAVTRIMSHAATQLLRELPKLCKPSTESGGTDAACDEDNQGQAGQTARE